MPMLVSAQPDARFIFCPLDQLDFVAVRVGHKGDHGGATFDRSRFARHIPATCLDLLAGGIGVGDAQGDVPVRAAQVIGLDAMVVGQLDFGVIRVVAVTDERQRIFVGILSTLAPSTTDWFNP